MFLTSKGEIVYYELHRLQTNVATRKFRATSSQQRIELALALILSEPASELVHDQIVVL